MKLTLIRDIFLDDRTLGRLYIGKDLFCYTVEDAVREIEGEPVASWKIPGETAIPYGTYEVRITHSNRFQRDLPLLLDVEGFTGIRIHSGNGPDDTEGCIIVGMERTDGGVLLSRIAMGKLIPKIRSAEDVWIEIKAGS